MEFKLGAPVQAYDGALGTVSRIIFDPAHDRVLGVVVAEPGLLPHDLLLPVERVGRADENGIHADGTLAELQELPAFSEGQYVAPPDEWIPPAAVPGAHFLFPASPYTVGAFQQPATQAEIPAEEAELDLPGAEAIRTGAVVYCGDEQVGTVDAIVTDEVLRSGSHLVIGLGGRYVTVPSDHVEAITSDAVHLDLTPTELNAMPDIDIAHAS